ncbi:MAG: hypothetical protein IK004_03355 [Bacteroidales bacterium]|nr:hypothetical protein [Bacteroidales bacterium]
MKKLSIIIISLALVLGLSQCKKKVAEITPAATPEVNGNLVHIRVNAGHGDKHIVYPESGAYVFENGDKLYVGNNGHYIGTLEYYDGAFSGDIETDTTTYHDYLHFYFIGGSYDGELLTSGANATTSFEWSIADQTGSKLPILSYGHSTRKFTNQTTAYSCMLENKCGLVKFWAWPAPSTSNTLVTISGMKTTALIDFANPGITSTDAIGAVKLHKISGSDPAERWAILLPQSSVPAATVSYKDEGNNNIAQNIYMPAIKANTYYGGYNGISVGLEYVDLGLESGLLWAACNVGSCTHEGYGKFFAWADTAPKTAYCWSKYKYAYNPKYYPECPGPGGDADTIHFEYGDNGPNLGLTKYNTKEEWNILNIDGGPDGDTILYSYDDAALAIMGNGWRTPTVEEWNELITETTPTRDVVNGIGGIRFTGSNGNSIFLPFAGSYSGNMHSSYYNCGNQPQGQYWSNQIDSDYPYRAYILYFDDPDWTQEPFTTYGTVASTITFFSDPIEYARYEGRPVRAVRETAF